MTVSAVIPHKNSGLNLGRCLDALAVAGGVQEVVVVDESSTDGSVDGAAGRLGVRVIASPGAGFAVAANAGIASSYGDTLLLLGSDAFTSPDTVERLVRRLEENPRLAACGAALFNEDGRPSKSYSRLFTLRRALVDALGFRPGIPLSGRGLGLVEAVFPNCLLARREALDEVGCFDERFRFYYEDMDLCLRLARAGWQLAVDWDAHAIHVAGGSTKAPGPGGWFRQYHESRLAYLRKHYPRGWLLYAALWMPKAALHVLAWRVRALVLRLREDAAGERLARDWAEAFRGTVLPSRPS